MTHDRQTQSAVALLTALMLVATPAGATELPGAVTETVTLRGVHAHPATPQAATRVLRRIGDAALLVCGASEASLRELKQAVRSSPCWRNSVADAVRRIDNALLTAALARQAG